MPFPNPATQFKAGAQQVVIARKGGKVISKNKKISARIRELKKKGLTSESAKRLMNIIEDADYSALDVLLLLESIKDQPMRPRTIIELANAQLNLHKAHHGEKKHITSENIHHVLDWSSILKDAEVNGNE